MPVRSRGNKWQADVKDKLGKRHRYSFDTEAQAIQWHTQAIECVNHGQPVSAPVKNKDAFLLGQFLTDSQVFLWGNAKSSDKLIRNAELCVMMLGPQRLVSSITSADIITLSEQMMAKGSSHATINRKLSSLQKLLKHARTKGMLDVVPEFPRFKESKGRIRFLSDREEQSICARLIHNGQEHYAHFARFLLYTGARGGEALRVMPEDIDTSSDIWKVTFWETKGGDARTVPLPQAAQAAVSWALQGSTTGKPLWHSISSYRAFSDNFGKARDYAGLGEEVIPYTLRHTCASRLVQRGVDLRRVQKWMGHKSIQVTLRYAHLAPDDLNEAAGVL